MKDVDIMLSFPIETSGFNSLHSCCTTKSEQDADPAAVSVGRKLVGALRLSDINPDCGQGCTP